MSRSPYVAACGAPAPDPTPGAPGPLAPVVEAPTEPCWVSDLRVTPSEAVPAARTAPLALSFAGHAPVLKLAVGTPAGELPGAVFSDDGGAYFVPSAPYPAGAVISWRAGVCGEVYEGSFTTGALHHALGDDERREIYDDTTWGLDLRTATWREPAVAATDSRLGWALGGALLVEVRGPSEGSVLVRLAPAVADSSGLLQQDEREPLVEAAVSLEPGSAYLAFHLSRLALETRGGPVTLRDVDVVLGLSEEGPADGQLSAEMDLRDWRGDNGRTGCELLLEETGSECVPCAVDGEVACAALDLGDVRGVSSDNEITKGG